MNSVFSAGQIKDPEKKGFLRRFPAFLGPGLAGVTMRNILGDILAKTGNREKHKDTQDKLTMVFQTLNLGQFRFILCFGLKVRQLLILPK